MLEKLKQFLVIGFLFFSIFMCNYVNGQNNKIDGLSSQLKTASDSIKKIDIHLKLAGLKTHSNSNEALKHIDSAQVLSHIIKNDSIQFEIYSKYINYYFINQNHQKTFSYIDSSLAKSSNVSPKKVVRLHTVLGQNSNLIGDYNQALTAYQTALLICEDHDLMNSKIGILNALSNVYLSLGSFLEAENHALEAIDLSKKTDRKVSQMYAELNLGHVYFKQGKTIPALKVYKIVETYLETNESIVLQHSINTALGRWYKNDNQYEKAIPYFEANLSIDKSMNNTIGINTNRADIAFVLIQQKKYTAAISLLKENLSHAKSVDNPNLIRQNLLNLSQAFEFNNKFEKALKYRKDYEKWQDSLVSTENLKAIGELEIKYESEKKQNEILKLSQKQLQNKASIEKQSLWIKRLGYGFTTVLLIISASFIIFKQRSKFKKQKELITAITDTQISEQQRISQDLHDSIGGSLALVKTKLTMLEQTENNRKVIRELSDTLAKTSNEVRQISHDLMPGELVKFGLISAVNSLLDQLKIEGLETNLYTHDTNIRIDEKKEIHIFRIIQELIQNVLKHAKANVLNVYINQHPKSLNLIVEDDGLGFDVANSQQHGIGFKTIQNRIDYLNGNLIIDSQKDKGTSFNIQIPLQA